MAVMYNQLHVDERYSDILEPNLYYAPVFVPGVSCTDKHQAGPAGGVYVHRLNSTPAQLGKPGRDFVDEEAADSLVPIILNNNFQKSRRIYGVQAAAVDFALAEQCLQAAVLEVQEAWQNAAFACLVNEGTAAADTDAIDPDGVKDALIRTRREIVGARGSANVVVCHPDFYASILKMAGAEFTPVMNERIANSANVGMWLGMLFIEAPMAALGQGAYYSHAGGEEPTTVSFADVDYIMYDSEAFSVVTNFEVARVVDSENFAGSKAQVELNSGYRVTAPERVRVRRHSA